MGILVAVVLDSGAFMTDESETGMLYTEVGYFTPDIKVYGDGKMVKKLYPGRIGTGSAVTEVNLKKSNGTVDSGIQLSEGFCQHMLRLHKLHGRFVPIDRNMFDCVFKFNSGQFRCSKVKARNFKEINGSTKELFTVKKLPQIAHDVVIHYELENSEDELSFTQNGTTLWSTKGHPDIQKRFDIEVMADDSTAEMYFNHCLKLRGQNYWLPNQGNPPPFWSHGTPDPDSDPTAH